MTRFCVIAAALLSLTACGGGILSSPPPEIDLVRCPQTMIYLKLPERPDAPEFGKDDLAALALAFEGLDTYADALEEQSEKRVEAWDGCGDEGR